MTNKRRVLIATLYESDPVFRALTQLGVNKLILIVDDEMDPEQEKSYRTISNSLGNVLDIETVSVSKLDIVDVSTKVVEAIDNQGLNDVILVDVTSGIKTVAIGTLYACFVRADRIRSITYNVEPHHGDRVITLPKIAFRLTEGQRKVIEYLQENSSKDQILTYSDISQRIGASRAMLYRNIDELKKMGLVSDEDKLHLTDAGRIACL